MLGSDSKKMVRTASIQPARCMNMRAVLAAIQDSMLPVEVGDRELRAGIAEARELLGGLRGRARELVRTLGR